MTWEELKALVGDLPGVDEGSCYGTPALRVRGKLLARLKEDGESVVLLDVPPDEREVLVETRPDLFFFTDHYRDWPCVLVRLGPAKPQDVKGFVERSWRLRAPKTAVKTYDALSRTPEGA